MKTPNCPKCGQDLPHVHVARLVAKDKPMKGDEFYVLAHACPACGATLSIGLHPDTIAEIVEQAIVRAGSNPRRGR